MTRVRAFIQARMSSHRLPGKVLAPIANRPLIDHTIDRVADAMDRDAIVVLTSVCPSDDPLAVYVASRGVHVYRGNLDDVFARFRNCLNDHPCDWFVRLSADSPDLPTDLIRSMIQRIDDDVDLITNLYPRSWSKGHSVEVVRTSKFMQIEPDELEDDDREHVTPFMYRNPSKFRIHNVPCPNPAARTTSHAVDTLEDFYRMNRMLDSTNIE